MTLIFSILGATLALLVAECSFDVGIFLDGDTVTDVATSTDAATDATTDSDIDAYKSIDSIPKGEPGSPCSAGDSCTLRVWPDAPQNDSYCDLTKGVCCSDAWITDYCPTDEVQHCWDCGDGWQCNYICKARP